MTTIYYDELMIWPADLPKLVLPDLKPTENKFWFGFRKPGQVCA